MEPVWLLESVVLAMHDRLLAEHGGASGVRDSSLLESALATSKPILLYGEPDVFEFAAAQAVVDLAAGSPEEAGFAEWLRGNCEPRLFESEEAGAIVAIFNTKG